MVSNKKPKAAVLFMLGFGKHIKIRFNIKDEGKYRHFIYLKGIR